MMSASMAVSTTLGASPRAAKALLIWLRPVKAKS
jgi:hypothetical protein